MAKRGSRVSAGEAKLLALCLGAGALLVGCAGGGGVRATTGKPVPGSPCESFDALEDLAISLQTSASFGRSSDTFFLVDIEEDLGYLHVAQKRLALATTPDARQLAVKVDTFTERLTGVLGRIGEAFGVLQKTSEAAEAALEAAALCQGVDLRDLSRPAGTVGKVDPTTREKTLHAHEPIAVSKSCEPSQRLWAASRATDLTSAVTSSSIAAHITELTLPGPTGAARDHLAKALNDHAAALKRFNAVSGNVPGGNDPEIQGLVALRGEVVKMLDATTHACRVQIGDLGRVLGGDPEPRRATVTVRPKWPKSLSSFPHPIEFGSGFVVRWRNANGQLEARVVTNNHVMDVAFEAEFVPGDPKLAKPGAVSDKDKDQNWSATLVQSNPHDDVAVLRLDPDAQPVFNEGFAFRLLPAREEEGVAAAGFPGIGARPSFQVTKGTVSNARFSTEGASANGFDVYVQHTAAIDPGNSGGPLLDGHGRLLGMNTFKLVGRENVGLAIPTWRIQEALQRAEGNATLDLMHAEASCNAVVGAFQVSHPSGAAASRFGLALYEWAEAQATLSQAASFSEQMQSGAGNPVDDARRRAYGAVRAVIEEEGGVRPFEACSEVHATSAPGVVVGTFHTRRGTHTLTFAEEHAVMRVVAFK